MSTSENPIRQKPLDRNLPQDSPLRAYLAGKTETGSSPAPPKPDNFVPYCTPLGKQAKTLLIMPPMRLYEGAVMRLIPPLGLCYIASQLEAQGLACEILDCIAEDIVARPDGLEVWRFGMTPERFREAIREADFAIYCLSMIYSSDLDNLYECAKIIREEKPDAIIVAGGIHATIYTERFLRDGVLADGTKTIDFVVRGEGEYRMADLIASLARGVVNREADGLAGWIDGELRINPQREMINDLDALPFPAYHKVPLEKYFAHNIPFSPFPRGKRVMQIYTSRGCPVGCTFCASTNFSKSFRARSVENVMQEIDFHIDEYGIDELQFADDNLTFDRARSFHLFRELAKRGLPWCTPNGIMVNTLTEDLIDAMVDSGLYQITLSVDSGSAETLKSSHRKPVNLDRIPQLMDHLQSRGVLMHGTLVVGMPDETRDQIEAGFRYIEALPFHSLNVFIAQAIPGSELFEKAIAGGKMTYRDGLQIDTARSPIQLSPVPREELVALVDAFLSRVNLAIQTRDPGAWERKYAAHRERIARIAVGRASSITQSVIDADLAMPTVAAGP